MLKIQCFVFVLCYLAFLGSGCRKEDDDPMLYLSPLHAKKGEEAGIYDSGGRFVLLRGVNYNVLGDYWQGNPNAPATAPYSRSDFEQMAAYGFNCVRLLFSWSRLQPQEHVIDNGYLNQIKRVIEDAGKHGLYVVLDMHQDAWGKYVATPNPTLCETPAKGWDGAPEWATLTNNASTCTTNGSRESAPAVVWAFDNFWNNTNNIQTRCIEAWKEVVGQTCHYTNVAGYDLLNEPGLGYGTLAEERGQMEQFYANLIAAIRQREAAAGADKHIIFFENAITLGGNEAPTLPNPDFSADDNMVFAPHHYFESITNYASIEMGYNILRAGAAIYGTALWVGEWGFFNGIADTAKIKRFAQVEDTYFAGSAWWQWVQAPGDPHGVWWDGSMFNHAPTSLHLLEINANGQQTGVKNEPFLQILSRTRPRAVTGKPVALTSNPSNGYMHFEATSTTNGSTEIWIPDRFGEPVVSGNNLSEVTVHKISGGYLALVTVLSGNYTIDVTF